jgi:hypothetical protein
VNPLNKGDVLSCAFIHKKEVSLGHFYFEYCMEVGSRTERSKKDQKQIEQVSAIPGRTIELG